MSKNEGCVLCGGSAGEEAAGFQVPMVSRVFDAAAVVFVAAAIVFFIIAVASESGAFHTIPAVMLICNGLLSEAVAAILRTSAESAFNTRELLKLKRQEHHR